jgi:Zn-finger nucleic acid-binding protein
MPYLSCPGCRLSLYTAAVNATTERCPRCDAWLVKSPKQLFPAARQGNAEPHTAPTSEKDRRVSR